HRQRRHPSARRLRARVAQRASATHHARRHRGAGAALGQRHRRAAVRLARARSARLRSGAATGSAAAHGPDDADRGAHARRYLGFRRGLRLGRPALEKTNEPTAGTIVKRAAFVVLAGFTVVALAADLIASDLPLVCRFQDELHVLPCLLRPAALAGLDNQTLRERAEPLVAPLIPYGPIAQSPGGITEV